MKNKSQTKARVFSYQGGSQRTFISQSLVEKLSLRPGGNIQLHFSVFISEIERKENKLIKSTVKNSWK